MAAFGALLDASRVVEEVVGVQLVIAEKIPAGTVHPIGAGLDLGVDDCALAPTELRVVSARLDLERLQGVRGRLNRLRAALLPIGRERVVVDSIQGEIVLEGEIAVDIDPGFARVGPRSRGGDRSRAQQDQIRVSTAIERQVGNDIGLNDSPELAALRLDVHGGGDNLNLFRDITHLQGEIEFEPLLDGELDLGSDRGLEPRRLGSDLVDSRSQPRCQEDAGFVGAENDRDTQIAESDRDVGTRNDSPLGIPDSSHDCARVDLCQRRDRQQQNQYWRKKNS